MEIKENFEKMEIGSEVLTKDKNWKIIEKWRYRDEKTNKIKYAVKLECVKCGYTKTVGLHHAYSSSRCPECHLRRYEGTMVGPYKVIKYERTVNHKLRYEMECTVCGKHYHDKELNYAGMCNIKNCAHCGMPTNDPGINTLYREYKDGAHNRKLVFNLTHEEFLKLINGSCYYCGEMPEERIKTSSKGNKYTISVNGIDRLDSSKGYTIDNCVSCCTFCNRAKSNYSIDYFLNKISKIYHQSVNVQRLSKTHSVSGGE